MASYKPISGTAVQEIQDNVAASGYYLKGYQAGTTTALAMGIDSTPTSTLAKCALDSQGRAINGSSAVFIPHFNQDYKLVLYANATDADADTFANAVWTVDNIQITDSSSDEVTYTPSIGSPTTVQARLREIDEGFIDFGDVATQISATSFSVPGDETAIYQVGRRIKLPDASDIYATIASSVYTTLTTVTIEDATGSLTSSLNGNTVAVGAQVTNATLTTDAIRFTGPDSLSADVLDDVLKDLSYAKMDSVLDDAYGLTYSTLNDSDTDCTVAFEAAQAAANIVYFPHLGSETTYRMKTKFDVTADRVFIGAGATRHSTAGCRLNHDSSLDDDLILFDGSSTGNIFKGFRIVGGVYKASATVSGATQAAPCVVTATAHGFNDGDRILIRNVVGMTELNSTTTDDNFFQVGNVADDTFELYDDAHIDNIAISAITKATNAQVTTNAAHGLTTGDKIMINLAKGMTEINNTDTAVTVVNSTTFTCDDINSTAYGTYSGSGRIAKEIDSSAYTAYSSGGTAQVIDYNSALFVSRPKCHFSDLNIYEYKGNGIHLGDNGVADQTGFFSDLDRITVTGQATPDTPCPQIASILVDVDGGDIAINDFIGTLGANAIVLDHAEDVRISGGATNQYRRDWQDASGNQPIMPGSIWFRGRTGNVETTTVEGGYWEGNDYDFLMDKANQTTFINLFVDDVSQGRNTFYIREQSGNETAAEVRSLTVIGGKLRRRDAGGTNGNFRIVDDWDGELVLINPQLQDGSTTVYTLDIANNGAAYTHITGGQIRQAINTETLSGNKTIASTDPSVHFLDAGGVARDVTLPAEADSTYAKYEIYNTGGETLTVKDDGASTIITIATNESGIVRCDGTSWFGFVGANT
jgi:uncharacterized protein YqfB (UPF0267 family)